ncbi:hypothetical protein HanXRQr2_Chr04g0146101 [Helianthus annuus]|uniref:Uncharacterized protein n=1 Tax=Helianthus annuus TaxID=4232 RepID=A0A251U762_HELAN|nr:hypothetical protein HanXRQr2_Chr04g0146101 [Helianthus annuus]
MNLITFVSAPLWTSSLLKSHLFPYVASSAFESIMIAICPFWELLKVTWLNSTNSGRQLASFRFNHHPHRMNRSRLACLRSV